MYPILVQLGPFTVYSLWVFVAIGFFMSLLMLHRLLQKDRSKLHFLAEHSLMLFFGGLLGARIDFILHNTSYFFGEFSINHLLQILYIWDKGLSFWGAVIGITIVLYLLCRKKKENFLQWLDVIMISVGTGLIFGNIGSFLDGQNYGTETDLPWGVIIESSRFAIPIHPTQIYSAIYTLFITLLLYHLYFHAFGKREGNVTLIGIASYSGLRFIEEFLRGDESYYLLGLREAQIYCLLALIASAVVWYFRFKKPPAHTSSPPTAS